ncbi:MAG: AAC(3) family N-acetyltransferase [Gemmatimonadota bacterium]|nr:AAC(3) family N-acetyltransferase [Gemmatimonadota bacterium]
MREDSVIDQTNTPATVESLQRSLAALGLEPGMVVLVHSSLSALGWVCGGAVAVVAALKGVLGSSGTLVMPAHSPGLSEPAKWENPTVPEFSWPVIREHMPAYDPDLTPTHSMGVIAETFRKHRGVFRSSHPQVSFCACGPHAAKILDDHSLDFGLGERSPLARIYDLNGFILLLGAGHASNTSMHLAEYRADFPTRKVVRDGAPIDASGSRQWATFEEVEPDSSDFDRIGEDFLTSDAGRVVRRGKVGLADCQLMPQRDVVNFAVGWMEENRKNERD